MEWAIYFWTRLDGIQSLLGGIGEIALIIAIFYLITLGVMGGYWVFDDDDKAKKAFNNLRRYLGKGIAIYITFFVFVVFVPTKQDVAMIYLIPRLCRSEITQEIPDDLKKIKDWFIAKIEKEIKEIGE